MPVYGQKVGSLRTDVSGQMSKITTLTKRQEVLFGVDWGVPTYIYETTDPTKPIRNFEVKQSVHDEPLAERSENGRSCATHNLAWLQYSHSRQISWAIGRLSWPPLRGKVLRNAEN